MHFKYGESILLSIVEFLKNRWSWNEGFNTSMNRALSLLVCLLLIGPLFWRMSFWTYVLYFSIAFQIIRKNIQTKFLHSFRVRVCGGGVLGGPQTRHSYLIAFIFHLMALGLDWWLPVNMYNYSFMHLAIGKWFSWQ